jgi:hypothetical protein
MGGIVMAATISANSAGGGGLVSSGDASGVLALQTAGVTALSIDASQKVTFANSLTSPTLVTPALGTPSSGDLSSCTGSNLAKAWVAFTGATAVIKSAFNVSSVTRTSTGSYTINFTTAFANTNYSPVVASTDMQPVFLTLSTGNLTTQNYNSVNALVDATTFAVQVMG